MIIRDGDNTTTDEESIPSGAAAAAAAEEARLARGGTPAVPKSKGVLLGPQSLAAAKKGAKYNPENNNQNSNQIVHSRTSKTSLDSVNENEAQEDFVGSAFPEFSSMIGAVGDGGEEFGTNPKNSPGTSPGVSPGVSPRPAAQQAAQQADGGGADGGVGGGQQPQSANVRKVYGKPKAAGQAGVGRPRPNVPKGSAEKEAAKSAVLKGATPKVVLSLSLNLVQL